MKKPILLVSLTLLAFSPFAAGSAATPSAPAVAIEEPAPDVSTSPLQVPVIGTLSDGRTFTGTLIVTKFSIDESGKLLIDGILTGVVGSEGQRDLIQQIVTGISSILTPGPSGCDVLNLDLGPLNLDLLGLVVDLEPVILDVVAQPGSGNLLGNLLCGVVGLLNNPLGSLLELGNLLEQINSILSGD